MIALENIQDGLQRETRTWLVTGAAGFIGSNLVEQLLNAGQRVQGIDNYITGRPRNLNSVKNGVGADAWNQFTFLEGDINDLEQCRQACNGVEIVLHQAAFVSVPRSFQNPIMTAKTNVLGFLNMLLAAREASVKKFVYATSSSVYGDHPQLPRVENNIGKPMSPYAVSKYTNELFAHVFADDHAMQTVGLRYFNVFGKRQDPNSEYAAVIPKFASSLLQGKSPAIFGDGETTRDFCHIDNIVQANLLAALSENSETANKVYNVGLGRRATLNQLFKILRQIVAEQTGASELFKIEPEYRPFRPGDIRHTLADITLAKKVLGYNPTVGLEEGLGSYVEWLLNEKQQET